MYHKHKCEFGGMAWIEIEEQTMPQDDDKEVEEEVEESKKGLCGLQNLGNTCYMNSALQCLSNTPELTEYFKSNTFKSDINLTNVLGTKGVLAKKYANFVKNLWYGTKPVYSPWSLKMGI